MWSKVKKRLPAFIVAAVLFTVSITGGAIRQSQAAESSGQVTGKFSGTARGFGGDITVSITVKDGVLTGVEAKGDKETQGIGSLAIEQLPAKILAAGTPDVDAVTGATISSSALIQAAKDALRQSGMLDSAKAKAVMKPGVYKSEANGFALCEPLKVSVCVSDKKILDISVNITENAETPPILDSVIELLIPRMLENQSVRVDAITGATATSSAIKSAAEKCLVQALEAGGSESGAIENFYTVPEKTGGAETLDTDVLVIGMGGSGTYFAMSAIEQGVSVLAIDKTGKYGGTTSLTSEIMAINPPRIQAEYNNGNNWVDKAAMRKAWLEYTEGDAKEEMVDMMLNHSGEAIDWLVYEHDFAFDYTPKVGFTPADVYPVKYQFLPNTVGANKAYIANYFDKIYTHFTEAGGKYMLETEGYALIQDKDGKVVGAKARNLVDGTEYTIRAKAVVLATGGFAGNGEMQKEYLSDEYFELKGEWNNYGLQTNDGKMIQAAIDMGAGTYNIGMPPMVHNAATPSFLPGYEKVSVEGQMGARTGRPLVWSAGDLPMGMVISKNSLAVNKHGERFTTEEEVAMLNSWIAGPRFYSIWSAEQIDTIKNQGFSSTPSGPATIYLGYQGAIPEGVPIENAYEVLDAAVEAGIAYKANSLTELAKILGMEPGRLTNTVETYNGYCDTKTDQDFGKDPKYLEKIGQGPYYGIVGAPWCYSTCGALDINTKFQVLRADGETPIGGLYAIGSDSMGVLFSEKKAYVTYGGGANGWAMTSGKLAGEIIPKEIAK